MPSQRNDLGGWNINDSKNTRMDFSKLSGNMDYRKDEIMHIARYTNGAETMSRLSKRLGRPIRVLDIGCGEMNTVRLFYKAMQGKKADTVAEYTGIDIDFIMAEKAMEKYGRAYKVCNAKFIIQDLTQDPHIDVPDGYYDLIVCFEFLEHIKTIYSQDIIREAYRVLNKNGEALFSTPNSNGSNIVLPKDHVYEYSYQELIHKFSEAGFAISDSVGVCINISKIPKEEVEAKSAILKRFYSAFGQNSAFASVAVAPIFKPEYCKNVLYHLKKARD